MVGTREAKAIERLRAALSNWSEVNKKWENRPPSRTKECELTAAHNEQSNAINAFIGPWAKYEWPEDIQKGFGINH